MSSQFLGLQISKTGLNAYQTALNTSAHNISNAETKGYSRQQVIQSASQALRANNTYGMIGTGVDVDSIDRVHNTYYDTKYWNNQGHYGEYASKEEYMLQIQEYFSEVATDGFTTEFNNLFNSLTDLTSSSNDTVKKVTATSYAQSLCEYFNELATGLNTVQTNANDEIKTDVDRINAISNQLSSLNQQIKAIEVTGLKANDLRDQRETLIDELSTYVNTTVKETDIYVSGIKNEDGSPMKSGLTSYAIYIDNQLLVDDTICNQLVCVPRENKVNDTDVKGLFDVYWNSADGIEFNLGSSTIEGNLKGLYDIRDGNNNSTFKGTVTAADGATDVTIDAGAFSDINRVNLADEGQITIDNILYNYNGFDMETDGDGNITSYTFHGIDLASSTAATPTGLVRAGTNVTASVGNAVDYKGVVYYQEQLNQFVRTLAKEFNTLHNSASDIDKNPGLDFFTTANPTTGDDYVLEEDIANQTISSKNSSYYRITAGNFKVNSAIYDDPNKFYVSTYDELVNGVEGHSILDAMIKIKEDTSVFSEGTPAQYLESVVANIAVNTSKATTFSKNMEDVLNTIQNQQLSVSGVDTNEESADLVKFQNGYNLSAKIMSVLDEVYDKLINGTGV